MRQLPLSRSLVFFLDELEFTEAALAAHPDAAALAPAFQQEIEGWDSIFRAERTGRRAVTRAEAVVAVRNVQIDTTTKFFGNQVLVEAKGDRQGTFFRRFFPVAPSVFVRQALRKQCQQTRDVILPELDKLPADSLLQPYRAALDEGTTAAVAALDGRNQAKANRQISSNDVDEWKEGVNRLRLTTYAELLKIAADNGYGKSWADSFFPTTSRSGADEEPEPESPTPAPPTPPT